MSLQTDLIKKNLVFIRFLIVGGLNTAFGYFVFAIFMGLIFLFHSQSSEGGVFGGTDEPSYNVSDNEASISFNTEQDVRTYLCNHRFKSSDGYTLSFSRNAYEVSINGRVLTSTTDVYVSSTTSASIRTHGPYGKTTFRLSVSGGDGVITDSNDGESYYSR